MDTSLPFWVDSRRLSFGSLVCLLFFPFPPTCHCRLSSETAINLFTAYGWTDPYSLPSPSDSSTRKVCWLTAVPATAFFAVAASAIPGFIATSRLCYFLQILIHLLFGYMLIGLSFVLVHCTEVLPPPLQVMGVRLVVNQREGKKEKEKKTYPWCWPKHHS